MGRGGDIEEYCRREKTRKRKEERERTKARPLVYVVAFSSVAVRGVCVVVVVVSFWTATSKAVKNAVAR